MITKTANSILVKTAVDPEVAEALKKNKAFRAAWIKANADGGGDKVLNDLYREHINKSWFSAQETAERARAGQAKSGGPRGGNWKNTGGSHGGTFHDDFFANSGNKGNWGGADGLTGLKAFRRAAIGSVPLAAFAAYNMYQNHKADERMRSTHRGMKKAAALSPEVARFLSIAKGLPVGTIALSAGATTGVDHLLRTKKDEKTLREYHGLSKDDSLNARLFMNNAAGGTLGSIAGASLASAFSPNYRGTGRAFSNNMRRSLERRGAFWGAIFGDAYVPGRYSGTKALAIRNEQKELEKGKK